MFWERSESAIRETDIKYGKLCRHIAMNIVQNIEDVEECINDTYLGAWNAMPQQRPEFLSAFFCRIARNLALKKYEYNSAKKRNAELEISLSELNDCISSGSSVESEYEVMHIAKIISDLLRTLSYENRNVFLRRYWYYDSITDIAGLFGMSESKVKSCLFRTRNKLKEYFEKEGIII